MANIHGIRPFFVEFPVVSQRAGNLPLETGSIQAASTTTQSRDTGEFLAACQMRRIGGIVRERPLSETAHR
jgi:hypothetical protein